ncbi:MAG TPA: methylmalonyl-CoA mutase subunit beta [Actinophytocola sp.]|uniref:methylmalonyl-CoA mutase subunit beta n=1 Tax=Actinophytocola sp. TaxID=1872138 RepID=UPI002DBAE2FF|nr:methylmalonyl-CoA mutase subunit beta [Actinophytocola sp.]HEU5470401.1 methylmalonyl-CoA mutase subunit beta [Actinophytocola sp.]
MTAAELSLAGDFPPVTREQWLALAGPLEKLANTTYDGIVRAPLYTADDVTAAPGPVGNAPGWDVRQRHDVPDAAAILDDLEHGVTSLWLVDLPADALPELLREVYLDLAPVTLDAGAEFATAAQTLLRIHEDKGIAPDAVRGNLGADPLGLRASTGADTDPAAAARLASRVAAEFPALRAFVVDALPYHEAGGSDAQELGCALATGVAYLRAGTAAGLSPAAAAGQLEFRYAATVDQFLTIAKLRAARRLWARVGEVCGITGAAQLQHAVTSPAALTRRDPWVNMLRSTLACFAAGVGGADAITVLPFDSAVGLPDAFGRRIARNTQSILLEESHVATVLDPAAESWYVERLTDELAETAWEWFTEIERSGGMSAALDSGMIADRLARTWRARSANIADGTDKITGVTVFAKEDEQPLVRPPAPAARTGGLPRVRYAEEFES